MEGLAIAPFLKLLETSGPTALVGVVFAAAWWFERKENQQKEAKLLKLATSQMQINTKLVTSLRALREQIRQSKP